MNKKQPVALLTGAGRSSGAAIARHLAAAGYTLILNSRSADPSMPDQGAYGVKKAVEDAGGHASVVRADINKREERQSLLDFIAQHYGSIDLLVNNSGVSPRERCDLLEAGEASLDRMLRHNLKGPFWLTQAVARRMIEWKKAGAAPSPRIVFVTSILAAVSSPGRGDYCIAKAGLSMAARLFADRLAEVDIPVLEVRPGIIQDTASEAACKVSAPASADEGIIPQGRWGTPDDVGRAVAAIARGDLDYCTGQVIEVAGGFGLKRL